MKELPSPTFPLSPLALPMLLRLQDLPARYRKHFLGA